MMATGYKVILDKKVLERMIQEVPERAEQVVQKLAQDCEGIAKNSMSANSPSRPGQPPAVVTGNLKNSIVAVPIAPFTWACVSAATDETGRDYGRDLEFGTMRMKARPFMLPAAEKVAKNAPDELKAVVEKIK